MKDFTFVEKKGDVTFYKDSKENLYQQLGTVTPIFKVRDGSITYKPLTTVNGYTIKYNNNGVYGYAIFKGKTCLEDRIWEYKQAVRIATEMSRG